METEELKRKLMGLWEKTTHNSKELVATLFDYYFDINLIEFKEMDGKVVSALFGIPYVFGYGKNNLKGLYLISLSSEEGFRKKGILSELLNNLNDRVKEEFDFTFIVPHTELLADYYGTLGYLNSSFIFEERYTPLHDFKNDYLLSLNDSDERIRDLKKGLLDEIRVSINDNSLFTKDQIIRFIESIENKSTSAVNLMHSSKDLDYILQDQNLRNLTSCVAYDQDGRITGVAFTQKEELKRIKVVANYVADTCSYFALLDFIKRQNQDYSISVNTSDPKFQTHSIIQQTYASENPAGGDLDNTFSSVEIAFNINRLLQPLGMVRLLNFHNIIEYLAQTRSDVDFKLSIRNESSDISFSKNTDTYDLDSNKEDNEYTVYIVKNGKCKIEHKSDIGSDRQILYLSSKEVSELLLRKNDSSNLIMEAFGIPRLNIQIRLLPI
ncbi:MAG: hypothetical protein J1E16_03470 [Muribaculaceae bacterium]|nr:hypothetical protein [Muribaculaceae bacterium]